MLAGADLADTMELAVAAKPLAVSHLLLSLSTYCSGQCAPLSSHALTSAPNSAWVPGAGMRSAPQEGRVAVDVDGLLSAVNAKCVCHGKTPSFCGVDVSSSATIARTTARFTQVRT